MISPAVGCRSTAIELNVWRMAATVPMSPSSGNHSAPCARCESQWSARSSKFVSFHRRARQARNVWATNRLNPLARMSQSTADVWRRSRYSARARAGTAANTRAAARTGTKQNATGSTWWIQNLRTAGLPSEDRESRTHHRDTEDTEQSKHRDQRIIPSCLLGGGM